MLTFFQAPIKTVNDIINDATNFTRAAANFAQQHPSAFSLVAFMYVLNKASACYMVYCAYKGNGFTEEQWIPNVLKNPSNLTQFCLENNYIKPSPEVIVSDSMYVGGICNLTCKGM